MSSLAWAYDPTTKAYTLVHGSYRSTVRHTAAGAWLAIISRAGEGTAAYSFEAPREAKAWCEARIAELAARSRR